MFCKKTFKNTMKDRLPPNQQLRTDFPILHFSSVPVFEKKTWTFFVKGLVENPITLGYDELLALPSAERVADFHCVTGWSQFDLSWKGVLFKTLTALVKPLQRARFVNIVAENKYTTNISLEIAMNDDVILAYAYDGKPLTPEHGFPLRLVVPRLYAYKSAKWVRGIEFLKNDKPGFWETRGYSNTADPWKEERFA